VQVAEAANLCAEAQLDAEIAVHVALASLITSAEQLDPDVAKTVPAPDAVRSPDAEMVEDAAAVAAASKTEPSNPKLKSPNGSWP